MNTAAFISILPVIGQGLLGVFAVIAVIWFVIIALTKLFR